MKTFEEKVAESVEQKLREDYEKGALMNHTFGDTRWLPEGFSQEIYDLIDLASIKRRVARNLEDSIVSTVTWGLKENIVKELKDTFSTKETRDAIRGIKKDNATD